MELKCILLAPLALSFPGSSEAAEYMTSVTSEVYQVNGTPREIASRAMTCISQHLAPGTVDAQLVISSDLDDGIIVARSALEYGSLPRWKVRSRFTFEARDGRFRIEQTNLERFNDQFNVGSQWKMAEEAFAASASVVAQCVINAPKRADW